MQVCAKSKHGKDAYVQMCKAIDLSKAREREKEREICRKKKVPNMLWGN